MTQNLTPPPVFTPNPAAAPQPAPVAPVAQPAVVSPAAQHAIGAMPPGVAPSPVAHPTQAYATPAGMETIPEAVPGVGEVTDIDMPDINDVQLRDFAAFTSKLEVRNPDHRLEYRWVKNDSQRFQELYMQGYRPVKDKSKALSELDAADHPELFSGKNLNGDAQTLILMARPKHLREQRDANFRRLMAQNQTALDPKQYMGNQAGDAEQFQGALRYGVSDKA